MPYRWQSWSWTNLWPWRQWWVSRTPREHPRTTEDGHVLFFNCYLSATPADPVLFAGNAKQMPDECARQLFEMSSVLPESIVRSARWNGQDIEPNARGMAVNADMVYLLRFINMGDSDGPRSRNPSTRVATANAMSPNVSHIFMP